MAEQAVSTVKHGLTNKMVHYSREKGLEVNITPKDIIILLVTWFGSVKGADIVDIIASLI